MSEFELSIERAFDTEALSLFNSGVREIDLLIHKRSGGLLSFIEEVPCEFYVAKVEDEPVALFVLSDRMVTVNDEKYSAVGFYEKCGFVRNGDKQGNTIPMFKYLDYQYVKEL